MNYLQMDGFRTIDLESPLVEEIDIFTLAKSLAHQNRFLGHAGVYSVAEHCVLGTEYLRDVGGSVDDQIAFLFHDAHEAYIGDLPTPAKRLPWLTEAWKAFEEIHQQNISKWLGGVRFDSDLVKLVDARLCVAEALHSFGVLIGPGWPDVDPAEVEIQNWEPKAAMHRYLEHVVRLRPDLVSRHTKKGKDPNGK